MITPLRPADLHQRCDPDMFAFETADELEDLVGMLGQQRAMEAIELATGLDVPGFNLFVLGSPGSGRHSFIQQYLQGKASSEAVPADWCYVNDFSDQRKPRAIALPPGQGRRLRDDMARLIKEASAALPAAFDSEDYHSRRQRIEQQATQEQQDAFAEVQGLAQEHGLSIVQTATGFTFVPLRSGKEITAEEYARLPEEEKRRLQRDTEEVGQQLTRMLQAIPRRVRQVRQRLHQLDHEVALFAVGGLIDELLQGYAALPKVVGFLKDVHQDMAEHVELFLQEANSEGGILRELMMGKRGLDQESALERRYAVNLLVDHSETTGAPVILEDQPTHPFLVGQIEHVAAFGVVTTDFTLIRAGALHRANGGYLIIDVHKLLAQPLAYEALKRALKSRAIDIKSMTQAYSLLDIVSLEPEPIALNVKVVLIGERLFYYLLQTYDPEFLEHFKVAADFEDEMERSGDNMQLLARLLASVARREKFKPLDKGGIARLIEESARHAGDARMLSTRMRRLIDIMREAHYWAKRQGAAAIGAREVQSAIDGQQRRMSRLRDRLLRETLRGTILIETAGTAIGQVNGLAAVELGDFIFGHPVRITARVSLGSVEIIDIQREVELGGPIHSKGVLILTHFLASQYVSDRPLALSASLVFEQTYGPIEGDSASCAELCALLSTLAEVPVNQSLAITGSVDQYGSVQAIGAVNEKIEAFFALCQARGLTGPQGVVIPAANRQHLMLSRAVIDAVADNRFQIYAVEHIDQCLALITGLAAGERNAQGNFPEGTLNQRIQARLIDLSEKRRQFFRDDKVR